MHAWDRKLGESCVEALGQSFRCLTLADTHLVNSSTYRASCCCKVDLNGFLVQSASNPPSSEAPFLRVSFFVQVLKILLPQELQHPARNLAQQARTMSVVPQEGQTVLSQLPLQGMRARNAALLRAPMPQNSPQTRLAQS